MPESRAADSSGTYFLRRRKVDPGSTPLRGYGRDDMVGRLRTASPQSRFGRRRWKRIGTPQRIGPGLDLGLVHADTGARLDHGFTREPVPAVVLNPHHVRV